MYIISQKLLAPGSGLLLRKRYEAVLKESNGLVLDVGCGPLLTTPQPKGTIIGIYIDPLYVKQYTSVRIGTNEKNITDIAEQNRRICVVGSADKLPFNDNVFSETRCVWLLHHMPTEPALFAVKEMIRCTCLQGMVMIFDGVWPRVPLRRPLAWLTRRFDRGKWVRGQKELLELVNRAYPGNWRHSRFTYSLSGLEGLLLTVNKVAE